MRRRELASGLVAGVLLTTSAGMVVAQDEDVRMGDPVNDSSDGPTLPDDRVVETDDSALDPPSDPADLGDASIDMSLAPADSCVGAAAHTITGSCRQSRARALAAQAPVVVSARESAFICR